MEVPLAQEDVTREHDSAAQEMFSSSLLHAGDQILKDDAAVVRELKSFAERKILPALSPKPPRAGMYRARNAVTKLNLMRRYSSSPGSQTANLRFAFF
jgi:hypothetical protein